MDSSQLVDCSPPQYSRDIISKFCTEYANLTRRINSKKKAVERLANNAPKSIQKNITLQLSKDFTNRASDSATDLQQCFEAAQNSHVIELQLLIHETAQAELKLLCYTKATLVTSYRSQIIDYFSLVHDNLRTSS